MRFEFAWVWLAVPPLLAYAAWLSRRSYAQLTPRARMASLALRSLILVGLIAAISRPAVETRSDRSHVIFAVDVSRSVSRDNLLVAIKDIDRLGGQAVEGGASVSIVAFGRRPELLVRSAREWIGTPKDVRAKLEHELTLGDLYRSRTKLTSDPKADPKTLTDVAEQIKDIERFREQVVGDRTDVEQAVRLALNCGPTGERRTVYVFTDAQPNRGRWEDAWASANDSIRLHVVRLDKQSESDAAVVEVAVPPSVRINQGFTAEVRVASTSKAPAQLVVFRDGVTAFEQSLDLEPGERTIKVPGLYFRDKGFHAIEATVRAFLDANLENNANRCLVVVPGEARVLYVDSDEGQMSYLKSALELEGMLVEARPASGVPQNLTDLLSFDAFILSNVPADRLNFRQMQMVRTYVQDFGGGFVMLGGTDSFGLGGYYNTPIEEILPVRMPIQKDLNRPSLAIALVIDKSGSMSGVKIELAKRAAIATSEAINPRDLIGLVAFDSEARVLLELTPAADRETITSHIGNLEAGGGTFLYPALESAHDRLASSNARKKHVIVLSDGQTEGFGYPERVEAMAADGITLSAIGIGEGADMKLMEAIAVAGGGRAYFTNDFYSIPQIFTREALRASNSMLVERLVEPAVVGDDVCLKDIPTDELPLLSGYVATTARPTANLILASDSGDPILAKWRFGLGRTAAFTSEAKPRWAEDWIQWPDFAKFWSQLIRSVTGEDLARTVSIECAHVPEGDGVRLSADLRDVAGNFVNDATVELVALDEAGRTQPLPVERTGPSLFEALLPQLEYGRDRQFLWRVKTGDKDQPPAPYGFVYSFSPEFQTLGSDEETFAKMAAYGKGEVMPVGQAKLALAQAAPPTSIPLWPHLLVAALLLVPFDILVRRLG